MSDYQRTRDLAGIVTSRFVNMLKNLKDDDEQTKDRKESK